MHWMENPRQVLAYATVALIVGFTIIAAGVNLLNVLF